ncbi:uncharacterized protein EV422DRAFT_435696 [Fimicolochytrium jonesii]|uniref:uncharacterized protein n=1 Tax=Fimicolochytrium jonesii TaxID=1396493 RepID=UPI0022FE8F13|nr:uncharacterized protein EV422DRAFT_435696 [Fimicolochytrium jonesii]KAI8821869.1 hypothetical protein EV422DRAFT_435696 [Fimicolochytrium jonesii]
MPWYKRKPVSLLTLPPEVERTNLFRIHGHRGVYQQENALYGSPASGPPSRPRTPAHGGYPNHPDRPQQSQSQESDQMDESEQPQPMYGLHAQTEVWQIRCTGEIFTSYEDYVARYGFLRKRQFTCGKTGISNLTYEEALESERQAVKRIEESFPEVWRAPAIRMIHYSTDKLNNLIEDLYEQFAGHLYMFEHVYVSVVGTLALAKILGAMSPPDAKPYQILENLDGPFPTDNFEILYRVNLVDKNDELLTIEETEGIPVEYILPVAQLRRDRGILAKQSFKKFIRDVATRDVWPGAPWIVRPEFLQEYRVPDVMPPAVRELLDEKRRKSLADAKAQAAKKDREKAKKKAKRESEAAFLEEGDEGGEDDSGPKAGAKKKGRPRKNPEAEETSSGKKKGGRPKKAASPEAAPVPPPKPAKPKRKPKPKPLRFPMDDLELLAHADQLKELPGWPTATIPEPQTDFGDVPPPLVGDLIQVVNFLNIYSRPLNMFPFTVADFISSLSSTTLDGPSSLVNEAFACLLRVACNEYGFKVGDMDTPPVHPEAKAAITLVADDQSAEGLLPTVTPETRTAMEQYAATYSTFTDDERAALDQWWKWEPEKWNREVPTGKRGATAAAQQQLKEGPSLLRLKAWQIVLAGALRDCASIESVPDKWPILAKLLCGEHHGEDVEDEMEIDVKDDEDPVVAAGDTSAAMDIVIDDDETPSPAATDLGTPEVEDGTARPFGLRKRRRREYDDDYEAGSDYPSKREGDPASNTAAGRGARAQHRAQVKGVTTEVGSVPAPASKARATPTATASSTSGAASKKKGKSKKAKLAFDRLIDHTQTGFSTRLTAAHRVQLLTFLVDHLVGTSDVIRDYIDECIECANELRKEKREIWREKRELAALVAEFEKVERDEAAAAAYKEAVKEGSQGANGAEGVDITGGSPPAETHESEPGAGDGESVAFSVSASRSSDAGSVSSGGDDSEGKGKGKTNGRSWEDKDVDVEEDSEDDHKRLLTSRRTGGRHSTGASTANSKHHSPSPRSSGRGGRRQSDSGASGTTATATTSRVAKLQAERLRQQHIDNLQRAAQAAQQAELKNAKKIARERNLQRKSFLDRDADLVLRDVAIDNAIHHCTAASRMVKFATDRYHNRYWFFDQPFFYTARQLPEPAMYKAIETLPGVAGAGGVGHHPPPVFVHDRIYVECVGIQPPGQAADGDEKKNATATTTTQLTPREQDVVIQGVTHGRWGYYSTKREVDTLLDALEVRGVREKALKAALEEEVLEVWEGVDDAGSHSAPVPPLEATDENGETKPDVGGAEVSVAGTTNGKPRNPRSGRRRSSAAAAANANSATTGEGEPTVNDLWAESVLGLPAPGREKEPTGVYVNWWAE